jgi:hypothetical protein
VGVLLPGDTNSESETASFLFWSGIGSFAYGNLSVHARR